MLLVEWLWYLWIFCRVREVDVIDLDGDGDGIAWGIKHATAITTSTQRTSNTYQQGVDLLAHYVFLQTGSSYTYYGISCRRMEAIALKSGKHWFRQKKIETRNMSTPEHHSIQSIKLQEPAAIEFKSL